MFQFEKMRQNNQYSILLDPFGFHTRVTDSPVTGDEPLWENKRPLRKKQSGVFMYILEGIESGK